MDPERRRELNVPKDLYEKIGNQEKITKLIKIGLLSLRVTSLEREIGDLIKKIEDSRKRVAELPYETGRLEQLLMKAIRDRKALESLLDKGR